MEHTAKYRQSDQISNQTESQFQFPASPIIPKETNTKQFERKMQLKNILYNLLKNYVYVYMFKP